MDLIEVSNNQNRHPLELSRTKCILKELKAMGLHGKVLDIGCGDGYFDRRMLREFPDIEVYGVDIYLEEESEEGKLHFLNSLDHLPEGQFDYIIMMDVLEHIKDDTGYLRKLLTKLKKSGKLLITVPAFMRLYSLHDRELRHYRRYEHKRLYHVLRKCGLVEKEWSYFYLSLIAARLLSFHSTQNLSGWHHPENALKTRLVCFVLNTDYAVLRLLSKIGLHLPGLSLLSVCEKEKNA